MELKDLSNEQIRRYSRHLILPEVGMAGQKKICSTSVLCIGAGGLGSPIAMYLAAAGIGKIGIVDFDVVDVTNLQRQIIHSQGDVGRPKAESAKETILGINPDCEVVIHNTRLSSENALDIVGQYAVVVDGTDNFPTRYLTNDACVLLGKPNVYGSIFRFEGQASVFAPKEGGPCYRCLYPEPPPPGMVPSCAEGGVLGVLPGIIGCIQATEIIKIAIGQGSPLIGRLTLFNALDMKFRELKLRRDPECPICGDNPTIKELIDYEVFCGIPDAPAEPEEHPDEVTVHDMKKALDDLSTRWRQSKLCLLHHRIGSLTEKRVRSLNASFAPFLPSTFITRQPSSVSRPRNEIADRLISIERSLRHCHASSNQNNLRSRRAGRWITIQARRASE